MYQKQDKLDEIFKFFRLEPIAGLFYLQMNLLRLFYTTFWGKSKNHYLIQQFLNVLARKKVSMKIKDFYTCNDFFRTIVQAHIIALCIHYQGLTKINDLQTLLSGVNWPGMIAQIKKQYLSFEKVQNLYNRREIDIFMDMATNLNARKQESETEQETAIYSGLQFENHTLR